MSNLEGDNKATSLPAFSCVATIKDTGVAMLAVPVASAADCNELQTQLAENNPNARVGTVTLEDGKPTAAKMTSSGSFSPQGGSRVWRRVFRADLTAILSA
jgi:hypothetical protein